MRDSDLQAVHEASFALDLMISRDDFVSTILVLGGSVTKKHKLEEHIVSMTDKRIDVIHVQDLVKSGLTQPVSHLGLPKRFACVESSLIDSIIKGRIIIAVIPFVDSLVPVADSLNAAFFCPGNDPDTSHCRVDKGSMQKCLKDNALSYCESRRVSCINEALTEWCNSFKCQPVVMKPPRSGGSDGVMLCSTRQEIESYMRKYLNVVNLERNVNQEIIMQEHLKAEFEFVVNTVSMDGCHRITDIWISPSKQIGQVFIYDYQELVHNCDHRFALITEYICDVLNACGIRNGACHSELALLQSESFKLIEVNARVAGEVRTSNRIPGWYAHDQIYWLVLSILRPREFTNFLFTKMTSSAEKSTCVVVFLKSTTVGKLNVDELLKLTNRLKSFHQLGRGLAALQANNLSIPIVPTVDLISSPGVIMLVGPTAWDDYQTIRHAEPLLYIAK